VSILIRAGNAVGANMRITMINGFAAHVSTTDATSARILKVKVRFRQDNNSD
jgi:hypothetical protein